MGKLSWRPCSWPVHRQLCGPDGPGSGAGPWVLLDSVPEGPICPPSPDWSPGDADGPGLEPAPECCWVLYLWAPVAHLPWWVYSRRSPWGPITLGKPWGRVLLSQDGSTSEASLCCWLLMSESPALRGWHGLVALLLSAAPGPLGWWWLSQWPHGHDEHVVSTQLESGKNQWAGACEDAILGDQLHHPVAAPALTCEGHVSFLGTHSLPQIVPPPLPSYPGSPRPLLLPAARALVGWTKTVFVTPVKGPMKHTNLRCLQSSYLKCG